MSQRTSPSEAGEINREVSSELGRERNSGTSAEFGQKIGRAENLSEGGEMENRDKNQNVNRNEGMDRESSRRPSEGYGSSSGRSSGSMDSEPRSNISSDRSPSRSGSGKLGSSDSSEGRH